MLLDDLLAEFERRADLNKMDAEYLPTDDTQEGIEFAYEKMQQQLVELQAQVDFKIKECQELARACYRYKDLELR